MSDADVRLGVADLGDAPRLLREGRAFLDLLGFLLISPFLHGTIFFAMFFFALFVIMNAGVALPEENILHRLAADMAGFSPVTLLPLVVVLGGAFVVLIRILDAARAARLWAVLLIEVLALTAIAIALSEEPSQATWSVTALQYLYTYGVGVLALMAGLLMIAGIIATRRRPLGKGAHAWPRFSVGIYAARYGFGTAQFWLSTAKNALRFLLLTFVAGIAFFCVMVALGAVAEGAMRRYTDVSPVTMPHRLYGMGIVIWALAALTTAVSAVRSARTRLISIPVAVFAAFAALELWWHLQNDVAIMHDGDGPWYAPLEIDGVLSAYSVTEEELFLLVSIGLIWLFRSFISRALVRAVRDLHQTSARTARELSEMRPEPPVIFLRSFMDDEQMVPSSEALFAYAFGTSREDVRLEEIVAGVMFARGPLVALANPFVDAKPIGAARDVAADEDWQEHVTHYLHASQAIICFLGKTANFQWEIDRILALGRLDSMMLVLPPTYPEDRQLVHDAPQLAALMGLKDEADERERLHDARVIVREARKDRFVAIASDHADSLAYREAILMGAATIMRNEGAVQSG